MKTKKLNNWYAIRVPYGRELKLKELLDSFEVKSFIPMQYKTLILKEKSVKKLVPVIRNIIFVYSTRDFLNILKVQTEAVIPFRFMIDRAINMPIIVPDKDMEHFITVSSTLDEQLIYLPEVKPTLKRGDKVLIMDGVLKGVEGSVVRIKKDRRVIVTVNNIISVVTSYINPLLLKKIENIYR